MTSVPGPESIDDLLARVHVVALPMRVRFRGVTEREVALIDGPAAGLLYPLFAGALLMAAALVVRS